MEGIAEAMLLPELAKRVLAEHNKKWDWKLPVSLEEAGVSVINMNGIYFKHFMQLFCDVDGENAVERIPLRCAGITDNDPPKDSLPTPSSPEQGSNAALGLLQNINKSVWARLYPGVLKTFEYDLAMEGENLKVMCPIARAVIGTDGTIAKAIDEYAKVCWAKEEDETRKAEASQFLLDHIDKLKGEFAQALADHLSQSEELVMVPEYIRRAVVWACGGDPDESPANG